MGNKLSCHVDYGNIVLEKRSAGGNSHGSTGKGIEYMVQPTSKEAVILVSKAFPSLSKEEFAQKEPTPINSVATVRDIYSIEDPHSIESCYFLFLLVSEDMHELKDCNVIYDMMLSKIVLFMVPEKAPKKDSEGSMVPKKDPFDSIKQWFTSERRNFMKVYEHELRNWKAQPSLLQSAILEKLMQSAIEICRIPQGTFILSLKLQMHLWIADENYDDNSLAQTFCDGFGLLKQKIKNLYGIEFETKILKSDCINYIPSTDDILSVVYVHVHADEQNSTSITKCQNSMSITKCRKLLASLISKCIKAGKPLPYIMLSTTDESCCDDLKMSLSKFNLQWAVVLISKNISSSTQMLYKTLEESLGIDIESFLLQPQP